MYVIYNSCYALSIGYFYPLYFAGDGIAGINFIKMQKQVDQHFFKSIRIFSQGLKDFGLKTLWFVPENAMCRVFKQDKFLTLRSN